MPIKHNRFGPNRQAAGIVLVLCLTACERTSKPTVQGTEMRSALADLAAAEDVFYATNLRYSSDQSTIVALTLPRGVTLTIESADEHGWRATASHEHGVETCSESGRNVGSMALAIVEGPTCKPVVLTGTQRDVRGRPAVATAPVDKAAPTLAPDAPVPALAPERRESTPTALTGGAPSLLLTVDATPNEDFGYPTQTIDKLAVRRLLQARSYDALDQVLAAYADSVLRDHRVEYRLFDAYAAFAVAVPALEPLLTDWVKQRPTSAAARLARANFFKASGWNARGFRYAGETSDQQFARMGNFFRLTVADLEVALRLAPNSVVAYRQLIDLSSSQRDRTASRRFLDQALKLQPNSFVLRMAHMNNLLPRWGGSYDAMARFAEESAPYAVRNPRINALKGFVDWDKGRISNAAGKKGDAIEAYQRALQFGNLWLFRYDRGRFNYRSDNEEQALEDFNSSLQQVPQNADALNERSSVAYELGRHASGDAKAAYYSRAFRDIELAAALDPTDEDIQESLAFMRKNIPEYAPPTP
jgi:tetratricopeptide (TPR) repeat protein